MATRSKALVTLYFDIISPYSWIAFESLSRYEKILPISLKLKPIFLGGLLLRAENKGPATIPKKAAYTLVDLENNNNYWKMNMKWPSNFQEIIFNKGSLLAQRFLVAVDTHNPEFLPTVSEELWIKMWEKDESIRKIENLEEICQKLKIPKYNDILSIIESNEVKNLLKNNTDEAFNMGAFGIPWIVVQPSNQPHFCLFGSDRIHILCQKFGFEFQGPLMRNCKK